MHFVAMLTFGQHLRVYFSSFFLQKVKTKRYELNRKQYALFKVKTLKAKSLRKYTHCGVFCKKIGQRSPLFVRIITIYLINTTKGLDA